MGLFFKLNRMKQISLFFLLLVVLTLFGYVILNGMKNCGYLDWSVKDLIQSFISSTFIAFWITYVLMKKKQVDTIKK